MPKGALTPAQEKFFSRYIDRSSVALRRQSVAAREAASQAALAVADETAVTVLANLPDPPRGTPGASVRADLLSRYSRIVAATATEAETRPEVRDEACAETYALLRDARAAVTTAAADPVRPAPARVASLQDLARLHLIDTEVALSVAAAPLIARLIVAIPGADPALPTRPAARLLTDLRREVSALPEGTAPEAAAQMLAALTARADVVLADATQTFADPQAQAMIEADLRHHATLQAALTRAQILTRDAALWAHTDAREFAASLATLNSRDPDAVTLADLETFISRVQRALDQHRAAFRDGLAALEARHATLVRRFRNLDDRDLDPAAARDTADALALITRTLEAQTGANPSALPALATLLDAAEVMIEALTTSVPTPIARLAPLATLIAEALGGPLPERFRTHRVAVESLARDLPSLPLSIAAVAVAALETAVAHDIEASVEITTLRVTVDNAIIQTETRLAPLDPALPQRAVLQDQIDRLRSETATAIAPDDLAALPPRAAELDAQVQTLVEAVTLAAALTPDQAQAEAVVRRDARNTLAAEATLATPGMRPDLRPALIAAEVALVVILLVREIQLAPASVPLSTAPAAPEATLAAAIQTDPAPPAPSSAPLHPATPAAALHSVDPAQTVAPPIPDPAREAARARITLALPVTLRETLRAALPQAADPAQLLAPLIGLAADLSRSPAYMAPPVADPLPADPPAELIAERIQTEAANSRRAQRAGAQLAEDLWLPLVRDGTLPEPLLPPMALTAPAILAAREFLENPAPDPQPDPDPGPRDDIVAGTLALLGLQQEPETPSNPGLAAALSLIGPQGADRLTLRDFTAVSDALAARTGATLGAALGPDIGGLVAAMMASAGRSAQIAPLVAKPDYAAAARLLAEELTKACARFDRSDGRFVETIGKECADRITRFAAIWNAESQLAEGAQPQVVIRALMQTASDSAEKAANAASRDMAREFAGDLSDAVIGGAAKDAPPGGDILAALAKTATDARAMGLKFDLAALMDQRGEAAKRQAEALRNLSRAGDPGLYLALRSGFSLPADLRNADPVQKGSAIAYVQTVQKRAMAVFELCRSIERDGRDRVLGLFPGAALVEGCMTLDFAIADAIAKTRELIDWQEVFRDTQTAPPAEVAAYLDRHGLLSTHRLQMGIADGRAAARILADVLHLAPSAPVTRFNRAETEAAIDRAGLIYTDSQLARAWALFAAAQTDPQACLAAREAARADPKLAKYALAYGAAKGAPMAQEGMKRCGLNPFTLAEPDRNLAKVAAYLEARTAFNPTAARANPARQPWYPGPVALTLQSWVAFFDRATTKAVPNLSKANDISAITGCLRDLEQAEDAFARDLSDLHLTNAARPRAEVRESPGTPDAKVVGRLHTALYRLRDALRHFNCVDDDGMRHPGMAAYLDALDAQADLRLTAVQKTLIDMPWAQVWAG